MTKKLKTILTKNLEPYRKTYPVFEHISCSHLHNFIELLLSFRIHEQAPLFCKGKKVVGSTSHSREQTFDQSIYCATLVYRSIHSLQDTIEQLTLTQSRSPSRRFSRSLEIPIIPSAFSSYLYPGKLSTTFSWNWTIYSLTYLLQFFMTKRPPNSKIFPSLIPGFEVYEKKHAQTGWDW